MRILEVNKFCYGRRGAERHFLDVISLLSAAGHEVAVYSMEHPKNAALPVPTYLVSRAGFTEGDAGNPWQVLKGVGRLFWSFEGRRVMRRALDEFQPDIVHIHNAYHQLSPSFLPLVRRRGIPVILTVHDYHVVSPDRDRFIDSVGTSYWKYLSVRAGSFAKRLLLVLRAYADRFMGYYSRFVDAYIVPSSFVKDVLIRGGIPEAKIRVVPHFPMSEPSEERPTDNDAGYALYAGAVTPEKGIVGLVALFDSIRYPLVLAGRKTMEYSPSPFVRYVGDLDRDRLATLVAGCSFVVSASRLPETFGLSALEANAVGKPFVGYRTGALPEVIADGDTGWLADSDGSFVEIVREVATGKRVPPDAEHIRRRVRERFGPDRYLRSFLELSESLLEG